MQSNQTNSEIQDKMKCHQRKGMYSHKTTENFAVEYLLSAEFMNLSIYCFVIHNPAPTLAGTAPSFQKHNL